MAAPPPPPPAWLPALTSIERSMHVVAQALSYVAPNPMLYFWARGLQYAGSQGGALIGGQLGGVRGARIGATVGTTAASAATVGLVAAAIGIAVRDQIVQAQTSMFRAAAISGQLGTYTPYSYGLQKLGVEAGYNLSDQDVAAMQQGLASAGIFGIDKQFQQSMVYTTEIMRLFGLSVQDSTNLLKTEFTNLGLSASQVQGQVRTAAFAAQAAPGGGISPQTVEKIMSDNPAIAATATLGLTGDAATKALNRATVATAVAVSLGKESGLSSILASLIGPEDLASMGTQAGFMYTGPNPLNQYGTEMQNNPVGVEDRFITRVKTLQQTNLATGVGNEAATRQTLADVNAFLKPLGQQMTLPELTQLLNLQDTAVGNLQQINAGIQKIYDQALKDAAKQPNLTPEQQQQYAQQKLDAALHAQQAGQVAHITAPITTGRFFQILGSGAALAVGNVMDTEYSTFVGKVAQVLLDPARAGEILGPGILEIGKKIIGSTLNPPNPDTASPSPPPPKSAPSTATPAAVAPSGTSTPTGGGGGGYPNQPQTVRVEGQTNVTITVKSGNQVQTVQTPVPLTNAQYTNQRQSNNYSSPGNRQPVPGPTSTP